MKSYQQKVNAVLQGASTVKRNLKLPIGWTQTDDGKEKELALSIPIVGNANNVQEAIDLLARLPYDGTDKTLIRVGLPKTAKAGQTRLVLSPRMIPQRLACLVAYLSGYEMPDNIDEEEQIKHLAACGIEIKEEKSEREKELEEASAK